MKIDDIFILHKAKSKGFEVYDKGDIPFITNGFSNNGIIGYVTPMRADRVFDFQGICLSAFCEATVQSPPFLPRGNGGSGLLVLEPKRALSNEELLQIAAYINNAHSWRFSYGRMVNKERVKNLEITFGTQIKLKNSLKGLLPPQPKERAAHMLANFMPFKISTLFELDRGQFHALDKLDSGRYPTVSRVSYDNGIVGFYEKPGKAKVYHRGTITVATTTGDAFVQLDDFIATDNVVILLPKIELNLEERFFIAGMINKEKWRVSYGRQCYKTVFAKTNIFLPVNERKELDRDYMKKMVSESYNFDFIKSIFA